MATPYVDVSRDKTGKPLEYSLHGLSFNQMCIVSEALRVYHKDASDDFDKITSKMEEMDSIDFELMADVSDMYRESKILVQKVADFE